MTLVAALGRIDDIQQRIRSLSPEPVAADASAGAGSGAGATASVSASAFASAVRDVGGVGEVPALPAGPVDGGDIVAQAKNYLGVPYVFGGEDRSGMDCSGLVQRVLADLGIDAPRVVQDQADIGVEVPSLADARPGDLIVTKGEGHIVIYAGDGMVIHAPSPGKHVELRDNWLKDADIATIRRVVPPPGEAGAAVAGVAAGAGLSASVFSASALAAPARTETAAMSAIAAAARTAPAAVPATAGAAPTGAAPIAGAAGQPVTDATAVAGAAAARGAGASAWPAGASSDASADASASTLSNALAAAAGLTPAAGAPTPAPAASPTPAAPPTASQPPLAPQLTTPLVNLARSGQGEHTLTLRVSPEDLGPVTVKARITGSSVTIELASGTAAGRDALRALLVDLRRDLAVLVPHSSIAVTAADGPRADPLGVGTSSGGAPGGSAGGSTGGSAGASTSGQSFGQGSPDGSARDRAAQSGAAAPVIPLSSDDLPLPAPSAAPVTGIDLFA